MKLTGDHWEKNRNKEYIIDGISLEKTEEILKTLNGADRTELILEDINTSISVAGGNNGLFILNYFVEDDISYFLMKDLENEGEVKLVCGGQSGIFNLKNCFQFNEVMAVVRDYFSNKNLLLIYKWEEN